VKVFQKLKKAFITEPILAILDLDKEMRVKSDASDYISVKCKDEKWRPVAFISKSLGATE